MLQILNQFYFLKFALNMEIIYDCTVSVIPKHLGLELFEEILENACQLANPKIKRIRFKMGSSAGDNYCSLIYRTEICYITCESNAMAENQEKTLSVIIKSMPVTKSIDFLEDMKVFLKEKIFYTKVLPIMEYMSGCKFGAK